MNQLTPSRTNHRKAHTPSLVMSRSAGLFILDDAMENEWKIIEQSNGNYRISNWGLVQKKKNGLWRDHKYSLAHGYRQVAFKNKKGSYSRRAIHTLVLEHFDKKRTPSKMCRHLDGDKENNALFNLKWGTAKQNGRDTTRHGSNIIYDKIDIWKMKLLYERGHLPEDIGKTMGCSGQSVLKHLFVYGPKRHRIKTKRRTSLISKKTVKALKEFIKPQQVKMVSEKSGISYWKLIRLLARDN